MANRSVDVQLDDDNILFDARPGLVDVSLEVQPGADGSLVVRPHGVIDADQSAHLRQVLVHAVRRVRPASLILDLGDVPDLDPINLGTLAALCDLADDHKVVLTLENSS